ncbi:MAG: hypothetical protein ACRD0P_15675, partial [Stackebrandtia sp.]
AFHHRRPRNSSCLVLLDGVPDPLGTDCDHAASRMLRHVNELRSAAETRLKPQTEEPPAGKGHRPLRTNDRRLIPGCAPLSVITTTDEPARKPRSSLHQTEPPSAPVNRGLADWQTWFPGNHASSRSWYCHTYLPPLSAADMELLNPRVPNLSDTAVRWLLGFNTSRPYVVQELINGLERLDEPTREDLMSSRRSEHAIAQLCQVLPPDLRETIHSELSRSTDPEADDARVLPGSVE